MFITKDDIVKAINEDELNEIVRNDDAVIDHAISIALNEIKSHLFNNYDVDSIFGKVGNERDTLIVRFACDIAIYECMTLNQAGQDIDEREKRYKRAIAWIKAASKPVDSKDRIYPDLPMREEPVNSEVEMRSKPKRENYY